MRRRRVDGGDLGAGRCPLTVPSGALPLPATRPNGAAPSGRVALRGSPDLTQVERRLFPLLLAPAAQRLHLCARGIMIIT